MLVLKAPVDTASHGKWKYGGKTNKLYFLFGNRLWYIYAWEVLGTLSRFRWEKYASQNFFISKFFALRSGTSTNPYFPLRRAFLLLYAIFIFEFESPSSLIKEPTRRHYDRTWALRVANMRVCFMNRSMIEHDGLGITYFTVDILKDMVACWYAWVSELLCQN